jgi:hypothetical protein
LLTTLLILLLVGVVLVTVASVRRNLAHRNRNAAQTFEILRLEERNESLDRQNQLMERQYNLFATKPVVTYLTEEQFSGLSRVLASTIIAITKQAN